MQGRKKAVSLRLSTADLKKIRCVAERLGVRDSDVIRFAIKQTLCHMSPLTDVAQHGRALVPLFLEPSADLVRRFELDAEKLDVIINTGVTEPAERVSSDDLHLLAMVGAASSSVLQPAAPPPARIAAPGQAHGNGHANGHAHGNGNGNGHASPPADAPPERRGSPMRRYLYEKYLYRSAP
jgi:hypothetical protein